MSKLSRKRNRGSGPVTSTQQSSSAKELMEAARPGPHDRNEALFRKQLELAIEESKEEMKSENKHGKGLKLENSLKKIIT